jgi:glutathionylspermidine synthase
VHVNTDKNTAQVALGASVSDERLAAIRRELELNHCKWDTQVGNQTSIADAPLLMSRTAWCGLSSLAEQLFEETHALELELLERRDLHAALALPRRLSGWLRSALPTPSAARVMRFDFHPTARGWQVSEVNSDVPGGYTEATQLARLMAEQAPGASLAGDPTAALADALGRAAGDALVIATCAPGFMEDQQVVSYVVASLGRRGAAARIASLEQVRWVEGRAYLEKREVGAIFRFFQAEWLARGPAEARYLFAGGQVPVANPGVAVLTESKRLPLLWDRR